MCERERARETDSWKTGLMFRLSKIMKATQGIYWRGISFSVQEKARVRIIFCQDYSESCESLLSSCYFFTHNKVDSELWVSIQTPETPSLPSNLGRNVDQDALISEITLQSADAC